MHVHVLFDAKGAVLALFRPSQGAHAPQVELHPSRGQRAAVLEVPASLEALGPRELHAAVAVKVLKEGARLVPRPRRAPRAASPG